MCLCLMDLANPRWSTDIFSFRTECKIWVVSASVLQCALVFSVMKSLEWVWILVTFSGHSALQKPGSAVDSHACHNDPFIQKKLLNLGPAIGKDPEHSHEVALVIVLILDISPSSIWGNTWICYVYVDPSSIWGNTWICYFKLPFVVPV